MPGLGGEHGGLSFSISEVDQSLFEINYYRYTRKPIFHLVDLKRSLLM